MNKDQPSPEQLAAIDALAEDAKRAFENGNTTPLLEAAQEFGAAAQAAIEVMQSAVDLLESVNDSNKLDVEATFAAREERDWQNKFAHANRATKKRMLAEQRRGKKWKKGQRHA